MMDIDTGSDDNGAEIAAEPVRSGTPKESPPPLLTSTCAPPPSPPFPAASRRSAAGSRRQPALTRREGAVTNTPAVDGVQESARAVARRGELRRRGPRDGRDKCWAAAAGIGRGRAHRASLPPCCHP